MTVKLKVPQFKTEDQEREYWARMDLTQYFSSTDWEAVSFPNLRPTSRPISLRLPEAMFLRLKEKSNELSIPYQSSIKQYIAEGINH